MTRRQPGAGLDGGDDGRRIARDLGQRQPRPGLRRRPLDAGSGGHVRIRAVGPW